MIVLVPIGNIDKVAMEVLTHSLEIVFGQRIQISNSVALSRESWDDAS